MDYEKEYKDLLEEVEQMEDTKRYPNFRTLEPSEIDLRVAQVNKSYINVLLYKDARCDMNVLDDTVGKMNWKRSHSRDNANCVVEVWDTVKSQWIGKEDTGTQSFTEKEKGLASDSFKRSCFNWGIGRELYTAPNLSIRGKKDEIIDTGKKKKYNKPIYTTYAKFFVHDIGYDKHRVINKLVIKDYDGYFRYALGENELKRLTTISEIELLLTDNKELTGKMLGHYKISDIYELDYKQAIDCKGLLLKGNS
jgi:hypothetical protein